MDMLSGEFVASLVIDRLLESGPTAEGANCTLNVVVAFAARTYGSAGPLLTVKLGSGDEAAEIVIFAFPVFVIVTGRT
jgi:hypothetical protein